MPATLENLAGHRPGKGQFSFQSLRKAIPKSAQTHTIVLISRASKVMLKLLQARLQQYVNLEHLKVEAWLGEFGHYFTSIQDKCNCVVI